MKGARPLSNDEILLVADQFAGTFAIRNRSLFMLGVSVGGRISELLALKIRDVWGNNQPVRDLLFLRDVVKGKENARMTPVNADGRKAISDLIDWHKERYGDLSPDRPLFPSRMGQGAVAMTRKTGHIVTKEAFEKAGLNGKLATHSLRKSYAQRMYDASGDIYLVQEMLGHQDVRTTQKYLGVSYQKAQRASEAIETSQRNTTGLLLHSIDDIPDDSLLVEAIKRGLIDPDAIIRRQVLSVRAILGCESPINGFRVF